MIIIFYVGSHKLKDNYRYHMQDMLTNILFVKVINVPL